jgi:cystathionine beta-lyase
MHDLTRCVHHPEVSQEGYASLAVPTHRASTIRFRDAEDYARRKERGPDGYSWGLHGTPTTRTLEAQLSALEGAARTALMPSGQAAIAVVFLTLLGPGDTVLIPDNAYPPVRGLCAQYLAPRGIRHRVYDPMVGAGIAALLDPSVRLLWMESPGSTTMEVGDIPAMAAAARQAGVLTGIDNTWASPLLFKPLAHGIDLSMDALTKHVGGHSDLLMGAVSVTEVALHRRLKDTMRMLGVGVSPDDVSLALRGLETLGLRLRHSGRVALEFARRLAAHPAVARVLHPALPSCPGHLAFLRDFAGASGVFSIVLHPGTSTRRDRALSALRTFALGASWGGTRSLLVPMDVRGDRTVVPWTEEGVVLRISIGLEDEAELWADLKAVLSVFSQP